MTSGLHVSSVSVKVETTSLSGTKLDVKGDVNVTGFDAKVKLDEKERKSDQIVVGFGVQLSSKPALVKLEVEGVAVLTGKEDDMKKMLEVNTEIRVPPVLLRIYQHIFAGLFLVSTVLNVDAPPADLLQSRTQGITGINVEVASENAIIIDKNNGVTIQADTSNIGKTEKASSQ